MKISSIVKGTAIGISAGAVAYAIANSTSKEKRRLGKNTAKAIRAVGEVMTDIGSMMS